MQTSRCHHGKTMVFDNLKRNLRHFDVKKVEDVQLFNIKMKATFVVPESQCTDIIFCKIHGHFNMTISMTILKRSCILALIQDLNNSYLTWTLSLHIVNQIF